MLFDLFLVVTYAIPFIYLPVLFLLDPSSSVNSGMSNRENNYAKYSLKVTLKGENINTS